jgi:hypothetical protein
MVMSTISPMILETVYSCIQNDNKPISPVD